MPKKINTAGKRFNEIAKYVAPIPTEKRFNGTRYKRFTSSFSKVAQVNEAKTMRNAGIKVRMVTYKRADRNVYTWYARGGAYARAH